MQAGHHWLADGHEAAEQGPESISPVRSGRMRISGTAGQGQNGLSLDGPPETRGVGLQALGAPQGGRADQPGARGEAGQQVGQRHGVHRALGVQRARLVIAGPVVPMAGRGVPDQDQRHRGPRPQARDHVGVVGVAEPVQRLRQRQPGHRVDLVAGRGFVVRAERGPVVDLLGPAAGQVFRRPQPGAEHGPHAGLLEDLPDRGEQHVLAGLALALGQRPVVVLGPVHEQHLDPVRRRGARPRPPPRGSASLTGGDSSGAPACVRRRTVNPTHRPNGPGVPGPGSPGCPAADAPTRPGCAASSSRPG